MPKKIKKVDLKLIEGEYKNPIKGKVRTPDQIFEVFRSIKDKAQETLIGVYLSKDLEIRVYDVLSTGSSGETVVSPPEIFGHAYALQAVSYILVHNHPKGDPNPSPEDIKAIRALQAQSKIMQMEFLDFIIIGDKDMNDQKKDYWSLYEDAGGGEYSLGVPW
jgi:DNA repair protein RadC